MAITHDSGSHFVPRGVDDLDARQEKGKKHGKGGVAALAALVLGLPAAAGAGYYGYTKLNETTSAPVEASVATVPAETAEARPTGREIQTPPGEVFYRDSEITTYLYNGMLYHILSDQYIASEPDGIRRIREGNNERAGLPANAMITGSHSG